MSAVPNDLIAHGGVSLERAAQLARVVDGLDPSSLLWLSGYAAGLAAQRGLAPQAGLVAAQPVAAATSRLTIVYGSQTGNSQKLAEKLGREAEAAGLAVRVLRAGKYPLKELASETLLYLMVSTQGDGDPPDDARAFYDFLRGRKAPQLPALRYAVLALGDSSYPKFCETGRIVDDRLAELGATRLAPRVDCDVDFEKPAAAWLADALSKARDSLGGPSRATITALRPAPTTAVVDREHPHAAEVLANQRIVARSSDRDVRHIELSLAGSGLSYTPGDALGVVPVNPASAVDEVLAITHLAGDTAVTRDGRERPLREWLARELEITRLTKPFLLAQAERARDGRLREILTANDPDAVRGLLRQRQLPEVLAEFPAEWDATSLVGSLRALAPRMYSIASSQRAVGDEVHLTVAVVDDERNGSRRLGAASSFLAAAAEGASLPVFIEHNERFRLPEDSSRDVIMIGPGTGVAPFRAFVQERVESAATGRNWLFFGGRHFASEFLYQLEWQEALKSGALSRLDLAFSRDQTQKIYVQHRLREQGRDLHAWLEGGAQIYVCGDAERMAPDVHEALIDVLAIHGGTDREAAEQRLADIAAEGRYLRDVY